MARHLPTPAATAKAVHAKLKLNGEMTRTQLSQALSSAQRAHLDTALRLLLLDELVTNERDVYRFARETPFQIVPDFTVDE